MIRNALMAALLVMTTAQATAATADHVRVTQGWIRLLPGDLPAGAYAELSNDGDQPAILQGVGCERFGSAMLHQSRSDGGMSRMAMVEQLTLPARGHVALSPGGYHVMLESPKEALKVGEQVPLRLQFADGSALTANFVVRPASAMGPGD
jgi:periplasmic copper chaperone A